MDHTIRFGFQNHGIETLTPSLTQPPRHAHIVTNLYRPNFESKEVGKRGGKRREERERYIDAIEKRNAREEEE